MIRSNIEDVRKSLLAYKEDLKNRMERAVTRWSYEVTIAAVMATPLGDSDLFTKWYEMRYEVTGLPPEEGLARANWQVSFDGQLHFSVNVTGATAGDIAAGDVQEKMISTYKLGQSFTIGNTGPYLAKLENNYSRQTEGKGISKPVYAAMIQAYNSDFVSFINEG